ncbi:MAG: heavy-metal-associated domain-containing protein [Chloroflexota bacterium]
MQTKTVTIPNISCGHCVKTIQNEVNDLEGIVSVTGDETSKQMTISWQEPQTWDGISELLEEIEYPAETS